jgi:ABC-type glycerol-3-phosphate transport system permease component
MSPRAVTRLRHGGSYLVLTVASIIALFPILWTMSTSLKQIVDALSIPPKFVWFQYTLHTYTKLFHTPGFSAAYVTTLEVTFGSALVTVVVGSLAAYPIARRWRFLGRRPLEASLVIIRAIPPIVLLVPLFSLVINHGLYDRPLTLVVVYAAFNLPFAVWMMVSFIQQIPYELEESGEVDGANRLRILGHLVLPLAMPGLAATTILVSLIAWNEFLIPLVLAGNNTRTLPLLISTFVQTRTVDWGVMAAGATVAILPIAILTVLAQRSLVSGLGIGGVKQ